MTNAALIVLINAQPTLQLLADAGRDNDLADAIPSLATVTTPLPFSPQDIIGCVSASDIGKVVLTPMYADIQAAIQSQDSAVIGFQAQLCLAAGLLTSDEVTAIQAILARTQTQPDTSVTRQQVHAVLNANRPVVNGAVRVAPLTYPLPTPRA